MTRSSADSLRDCIVLMVDDHRIFADVIANHLVKAGALRAVHVAGKLAEARALAPSLRPDMLIVDYRLAGECGLDLLPELATLCPDAEVIVLSASRDPEQIMDGFRRGARAWVDKSAGVDDLLHAMRAVRAGDMYLSPASVWPVVNHQLHAARREGSTRDFTDRCTERELEVLRHLMSGMTRSGVADALGLSPNTVRTHVQSLFHTYGVHSTLALIAGAREAGLRAEDLPALSVMRLT